MKTYICDPKKCDACPKSLCQSFCFRTTKREQRATGITWIKYAARAVLSEMKTKHQAHKIMRESMKGAKRWTSKS